jgi:hypothetical protein
MHELPVFAAVPDGLPATVLAHLVVHEALRLVLSIRTVDNDNGFVSDDQQWASRSTTVTGRMTKCSNSASDDCAIAAMCSF